jgi:hypothetical protein
VNNKKTSKISIMHASNMNLILCFLCALSAQHMPVAFAVRPLKGTRGGGVVQHAVRRTLQDEQPSEEDPVEDLPSAEENTEEMPSADSEDSGGSKKGRVAGPSKRDCKMCKFQN